MDQPGAPLLTGMWPRAADAARGLILILLLVAPVAAASGVTVQTIEIRLAVDGGGAPQVVRTRLLETVGTVAQRLLLGRPVDQLRPAQTQLQSTLSTVVDRVISGYSVVDTRIEVGATAVIALRLRPDPPLIHTVEVVPRTGVHPAVAPLVLQPVEQILVPAVRGLLLGLPVGALDWVTPLIVDEVRRAAEEALPGFTVGVRVRPAAQSRVEIELITREGRVVRDIGVRFRSGSIPMLLLEQHAPAVLSLTEPLRGLPVVFAERHRAALERLLRDRLRAYPPVVEYHIVVRPVLHVAETTYLTVVADSLLYLGRVEAEVNVGTRAPAPELRLHLGRLIGGLEIFGEVVLVPNTLSARYDVGVRYRLNESVDAGLNVTLNAPSTTGWVVYRLSPDLSLRTAYEVHQRRLEGSLRYRFNEFLSGELVGTSRGEYWIRLISNL